MIINSAITSLFHLNITATKISRTIGIVIFFIREGNLPSCNYHKIVSFIYLIKQAKSSSAFIEFGLDKKELLLKC